MKNEQRLWFTTKATKEHGMWHERKEPILVTEPEYGGPPHCHKALGRPGKRSLAPFFRPRSRLHCLQPPSLSESPFSFSQIIAIIIVAHQGLTQHSFQNVPVLAFVRACHSSAQDPPAFARAMPCPTSSL